MRLFVGIDLPGDAKEALYRLTLQLKRSSRAGSPVPQENMHLTLAFLGEVRQIDVVKEALEQAAAGYRASAVALTGSSFELKLSGIGSFKQKKGHTWWVGLHDDEGMRRLHALHDEVVQSLRRAGFNLVNRPYKPHITLARSVKTTEPVCLEPPPVTVSVQGFCLFRSRRIDDRQEYSILAEYSL